MSLHDLVLHRTGRDRQLEKREKPFPLACVRLLRTDDDLHDAVEIALGFERDVVERTSARVSHYENLNRRGEILPMRPGESPTEPPAEIHPEAM